MENLTQIDLCLAPELSTLVALDATLLATIVALEFNYPGLPSGECGNRDVAEGVEEHLVDSIFTLATALRSSLAAYYAAIKEPAPKAKLQDNIQF